MANPRFLPEHRPTLDALCECVKKALVHRRVDYPESHSDLEVVFREILNRFDVTRLHDQREVWDLKARGEGKGVSDG